MGDRGASACAQFTPNHTAAPTKGAKVVIKSTMDTNGGEISAMSVRPPKESELSDNCHHKKQDNSAPTEKARTAPLILQLL